MWRKSFGISPLNVVRIQQNKQVIPKCFYWKHHGSSFPRTLCLIALLDDPADLSRGYKTFYMLNSTQLEIHLAHKC